jgi:hypothetical protein
MFQFLLLHFEHDLGGSSLPVYHTWPQDSRSHFHALTVTWLMLPMVAQTTDSSKQHQDAQDGLAQSGCIRRMPSSTTVSPRGLPQ